MSCHVVSFALHIIHFIFHTWAWCVWYLFLFCSDTWTRRQLIIVIGNWQCPPNTILRLIISIQNKEMIHAVRSASSNDGFLWPFVVVVVVEFFTLSLWRNRLALIRPPYRPSNEMTKWLWNCWNYYWMQRRKMKTHQNVKRGDLWECLSSEQEDESFFFLLFVFSFLFFRFYWNTVSYMRNRNETTQRNATKHNTIYSFFL